MKINKSNVFSGYGERIRPKRRKSKMTKKYFPSVLT